MAPSLTLAARAVASKTPWEPCVGCRAPGSFNNNILFSLFAILGLAMVAGSLWFFFHARNGGFVYHEGDWEDYKSTVLRRKGPDGKTIVSSSRAASTRYGGDGTVKLSAGEERNRWAAMSVVARDDKGRKGIMAKRGWGGTHSCTYRDDFTNYDGDRMTMRGDAKSVADWDHHPATPPQKKKQHKPKANNYHPVPGAFDVDLEAASPSAHHARRYKDRDVASYAREKPARVGGMNRGADGSHFSPSGSEVSSSAGGSGDRHSRAERKALDEAERMERQWRREARRAAEELRSANAGDAGGRAKPAAAAAGLQRGGAGARRTPSPTKKRAQASGNYTFSQPGEAARASYMDAYRPKK